MATFAKAGLTQSADPNCLGDEEVCGALSRSACRLGASLTLGTVAPQLDQEGRCLLTDHGAFVLLNVYAPTNGGNLSRMPFKVRFLNALRRKMESLRGQGRHVVLAGVS